MATALPSSTSSNWNFPSSDDQQDKDNNDDDISSASSYNRLGSKTLFSPLQSPRSTMVVLGGNFSSLGGGDAPLATNMPLVRSQLFTISTQAWMTSHSQMSFNYTGNGEKKGEQHVAATATLQHLSSSSSSVSVDSDIEHITDAEKVDVKPLNTDKRFPSPLPGTSNTSASFKWNENDWEASCCRNERFGVLSRSKRCIHGSLEDLMMLSTKEKKNGQYRNSRRKSAPIPCCTTSSKRGQMVEAANDLLVEENRHLVNSIQQLKRKLIVSKIATMFTLEAMKRRGKAIRAVEAQKMDKERECAVRLILHSLLLNSWRNTRRELDMCLEDNSELRKSVENSTLKVQVLRHVQASERQKGVEKQNLIQNLSDEVNIIKEENQIMRREMEKMENELNSLQASNQDLLDENKALSAEFLKTVDTKDKMSQALESEKTRSEQCAMKNATLKENLKNLEYQVKEINEQRTHWQERARCSESETWELQLDLESRNDSIQKLTATCDELRAEKMKLIDLKSQLMSNLDNNRLTLHDLAEKNEKLIEKYEGAKTERNAKALKIQEMELVIETTKMELSRMEKELLSYSLQNVRRRRKWGNALYFLVSYSSLFNRKVL